MWYNQNIRTIQAAAMLDTSGGMRTRCKGASPMSDSTTSIPPAQPQEFYLYIIQAGESAVKIGIANDVNRRLSTLQIGNHETLTLYCVFKCENIATAAAFEQALHKKYASMRIRGEWFKVAPSQVVQDVQFAARMKAVLDHIDLTPVEPARSGQILVSNKRSRTGEAVEAVTSNGDGTFIGTCPYCGEVFEADTEKGAVNALSAHIGRWCTERVYNQE